MAEVVPRPEQGGRRGPLPGPEEGETRPPRNGPAEQAEESTRVASNWVREEKFATALPKQPKITSGQVVVHKTRVLVEA